MCVYIYDVNDVRPSRHVTFPFSTSSRWLNRCSHGRGPPSLRHHVGARNDVTSVARFLLPVSSVVLLSKKWNNVYAIKQPSFIKNENLWWRRVRGGGRRAGTPPTMLFFQLPDDVLYHVLSYLDYKSLGRLSQVCKSTYQFVNRDAVWRIIAKDFLNTGITRNGTDK